MRNALVIAVVGLFCGVAVATAGSLPACSRGQLRLMSPQTQGTATQAVVFVAIRNSGRACRFTAAASLTVVQHRRPTRPIEANPISAVLKGSVPHGIVTLFDVWWSNWCGNRAVFDARATFASQVKAAPYRVLPACVRRGAQSRLHPVVYPLKPPPPVGSP